MAAWIKVYHGYICRQNKVILKDYNATICEISMQASSYQIDFKLFKPWHRGQTWTIRKVKSSTQKYIRETFLNCLIKKCNALIIDVTMQAIPGSLVLNC